MNRRVMLSTTVVLAVFLSGALAGAAVMRLASPGEAGSVSRVQQGADGDDSTEDSYSGRVYGLTRHLDEELDLSEEQRDRVREVLERREAEARRMFMEARGEFQAHLESTVEEVEALLTPEQAVELQRLIDRMGDRIRMRSDGVHPER